MYCFWSKQNKNWYYRLFCNEKWWEFVIETAFFLPYIYFLFSINKILGWKTISAFLAGQQDRSGIYMSRRFMKSIFPVFFSLPTMWTSKLELWHYHGDFENGIWVLWIMEQKYRRSLQPRWLCETAILALVCLPPVFL